MMNPTEKQNAPRAAGAQAASHPGHPVRKCRIVERMLTLGLVLTGLIIAPEVAAVPRPASAEAMGIQSSDATLVDQDNHPVRFASQAIGDQIVAINFIYTTCGTVCPLSSAIFQQLQNKLGNHVGRDVRLISITLDPETDTPDRLKSHANRYHARPGWLWLTGAEADIGQVLKGLGTSSANFREHAPLTLIADGRHQRWLRFNTLAGPGQLEAGIRNLLAARTKAFSGSKP